MSKLILFGIVFLFIGIILLFLGSFQNANSNVKAAGGIFIGPFPVFGFFSDKKMFYILLIFAIVAFVLFYILNK